MSKSVMLVTLAIAMMPGMAIAAPDRQDHPLDAALACRMIADSQVRLGCYDRTMATLEAARTDKSIYIVDREQARETRRKLFGLAPPNLHLFGGGDDGDEAKEVSATLRAAQQDRYGGWIFILDDGARWHQMDDNELGFKPKAGGKVVIRQGALGSFKLSIEGHPSVRVRREA
jgi:hypothetical protein